MGMNFTLYFATLLVAGFLYVISKLLRQIYQKLKIKKALKPFVKMEPHWFWGHLKMHHGSTEEGLLQDTKWLKFKPKVHSFFFGPLDAHLTLSHPDTVKQILKSDAPKNVSGLGYNWIMPWIGEGLLTSNGAKWFRNRKLLTPAFHFDILKPYVNIYNECVEVAMEQIEKKINCKESIEICRIVSLFTLDVMLKCAFSYNENIQEKGEGVPYIKSVLLLSKLIVQRAENVLHFPDTIFFNSGSGKRFLQHCNVSHQLANEVIRQRKSSLGKLKGDLCSLGKHLDFLDILLLAKDENGKGLTDSEIRDEVETFMFEGHDTTSSGISWALYNISRHPEIQEKVFQEICDVVSNRQSQTMKITWEDLPKLEYLTRCIKESLRLHPPVPNINRKIQKPMIIEGHEFPALTTVEVHIWNVHHNPTVWGPNAMIYDPDRFLPENINKMDSYSFIPFSAGSRNCIGQHFAMNEMKCTIARILHKYKLSLDESHRVEMVSELILKAKNGIKLYFEKRDL